MISSNIKQNATSGEPFPEFLIEHINREWRDIALSEIDPDICLQVDSSLAYCGCIVPSAKLRQFVYLYHRSSDFDHETIRQMVRIFEVAGDDCDIWDELVLLEFERDCGLQRVEYLARLNAIAERLEMMTEPVQSLSA